MARIEPVGRGVFQLPFTMNGENVGVAVDRNNDAVSIFTYSDAEAERKIEGAWDMLDASDPTPRRPALQVLRAATSTADADRVG